MANSSDIQVPNLLQIEIFEWLVGEPEMLAVAWNYIGEGTKAIARSTARTLCRENILPLA